MRTAESRPSSRPLGESRPYPAYKETSIAWLRQIPTHWEIKRLRFVAVLNPRRREAANLSPDTSVSFLAMGAIGDDGRIDLRDTRPLGNVWEGYSYFRNADVIVAKITPCFENGKGAVCESLVTGIGFGTTELHVIRPGPSVLPRYLYYSSNSHQFRSLGIASMKGVAGQQRVTEEFVKNFGIAFASLPEQASIVGFLDRVASRMMWKSEARSSGIGTEVTR